MKFPPWLENFQIKYHQSVAVPIARFVPGVTVIKHRGRTSGGTSKPRCRHYRKGHTVAIMLAHGRRMGQEHSGRRPRSASAAAMST